MKGAPSQPSRSISQINSDEPLSVDAKRKLASLLKQASGRVFDIWGDFQVHVMDAIQDMGTRHADFERHEISMRKKRFDKLWEPIFFETIGRQISAVRQMQECRKLEFERYASCRSGFTLLSELRCCYGWMSLGDLELVVAVDPVHRYCPRRGWPGRCKLFGLAKGAAGLGLSQRG